MATYLIVNLVFMAVIAAVLGVRRRHLTRSFWLTLGALLIMTAVFDSLIVGLGIVGYNPELILGIMIGKAPIEDFFYAVLAVLIVPILWTKLGKRDA